MIQDLFQNKLLASFYLFIIFYPAHLGSIFQVSFRQSLKAINDVPHHLDRSVHKSLKLTKLSSHKKTVDT